VTGTGERNGRAHVEDVPVEALLGRPVVEVADAEAGRWLAGATVLVTGAGGSLGVELCARLSRSGARELVLVDQAEAALVELAAALHDEHGFPGAVPVLADLRNAARADEVVGRHRPDVVFHAAAYKQVPLLEAHPVEAVAANVLATKHVVDAACRAGVARFVLFSTDKAVRPASILGQTKAVAEWIVAAAGADAGPRCAAVRLGNVVDSAGSILPLLRRQVARGGPVTVTHPETTRYLLSAAEAAGLAIVAGALAGANGIYWLDVGAPVRILDLARRLASGAARQVDVEILGLRAGERLHEQLAGEDEEIVATPFERVLGSTMRQVDPDWLDERLAALARHVERASATGVRTTLAELHASQQPVALADAAAAR
jgi:FlaA1/EpsC-like NDP-sugar epimerase